MAYQFAVDTSGTLMTNLVAYYKLDEGSGTRDDPIGGYDLTDNNTVLSATGKKADGADFERSSSEYLSRAGDDAALDLQSNFSVAGWVKLETTSATLGYSQVFMGKDNTSDGWQIRQTFVGGYLELVRNQATVYASTTALTTGSWFFFCVAYDGTNVRVYINGNTAESTTAYTLHTNSANPFNMGRSPFNTTRYLDGVLDEVGLWSKALTTTEIGDLYNSGNANTISEPTGHQKNMLLLGVG